MYEQKTANKYQKAVDRCISTSTWKYIILRKYVIMFTIMNHPLETDGCNINIELNGSKFGGRKYIQGSWAVGC